MVFSRWSSQPRTTGQATRRPFRLENLEDRLAPATFQVQGNLLYVCGTSVVDKFTFIAGNDFHTVIVETPSRGTTDVQVIDRTQISGVIIDGKGDFDTAQTFGNDGADTVVLNPFGGTLTGNSYFVSLSRVEGITAFGGANDLARFNDGSNNDTFIGSPTNAAPNSSTMFREAGAGNYRNIANGFGSVQAYSTHGGTDVAVLNDSFGNDTFISSPGYAEIHDTSNSYSIAAVGFRTVEGRATTGDNIAYLVDSAGNDLFTATGTTATMATGIFTATATNFNAATGLFVNGGFDTANFTGTSADENLSGSPSDVSLSRAGVIKSAVGADIVNVNMNQGGTDTATLNDSAGNDSFTGAGNVAKLVGAGYRINTTGFDVVNLFGFGGTNSLFITPPLGYAFNNFGF